MQAELDAENTNVPISLIGIGQANTHSNTDNMINGRDIPWLRDEDSIDAWGAWSGDKYELLIVDATGTVVDSYSLSQNNLQNSTNFDMVKNHLISLANAN